MSTPIREARSVRPLTAVRLVARRELNTRLRTRSFVIGTGVILVVLAGYLLLQASLFSGADRKEIGLSGQTAAISEPLKAAAAQIGEEVDTRPVADAEQGRQQVADGELDALLSGNTADLRVLVKSDLDQQLRAVLNQLAQQEVLKAKLSEAGADPEQVLGEVGATQVSVTEIQPPDPERGQRLAIGLIMVFLLYMSITTYGALVAQGVVEEKSSRVVEILLSTVRPWHLLLGKVIGLGLVGLTQLLILAGAGLLMSTATGVLTLSGVATETLLWGLLWYLLGFFLYATIFAAAGSLVSRQEDAQSVVTPVSMVLVIGFVVGLNLLLQDPESTASAVLSMIPLLSPVLMPGRIAAGVAAGWEIGLAVLLTAATAALFTWLGGKVYQNAVLRTGSRIRLTDALRG
ncbi:ABC transporter permease [Amycolatopsis nigrescens]|uniref:ABC transporter permease n=1 Tax=Amycolatopsis nigrescens TaxID=381445 RepID=UPI000366EB8A|nr:ABC transporter permease [Amycolatopsis nigrescens]